VGYPAHNGGDHALKVISDEKGLAGHAGAILPRKAADQGGLTAQLSAAPWKKGTSPMLDRGIVLVSVVVSIALGATSMSDIALLAHLAPVFGTAPSGSAVRRALAGKILTDWLVIDMDATLVTSFSDKGGAAAPCGDPSRGARGGSGAGGGGCGCHRRDLGQERRPLERAAVPAIHPGAAPAGWLSATLPDGAVLW
jgi:hypothetical protein